MKSVIEVPAEISDLARIGQITLGWEQLAEGVRPIMRDSASAANYLRPLFPDIEVRERVIILLLNHRNEVIGNFTVGVGSATQCTADVRMIVQVTLGVNATAIMLSHCHPSGNPKVSTADIDLTNRVKAALAMFDISVIDHVILLPNGERFSFADDGLI